MSDMQYLLIDATGSAFVLDERPTNIQAHQRALPIQKMPIYGQKKLINLVRRYLADKGGQGINMKTIQYMASSIYARGK